MRHRVGGYRVWIGLLATVWLGVSCRMEEPVPLESAQQAAPPPPGAGMQPVPEGGQVFIPTEEGGFLIDRYEFPGKPGVKPMTYVSATTAAQECEKVGRRLCTAAEWRRACLGEEGKLRYGYGPAYLPQQCHSGAALPSGHTSMMDPTELVARSGAFPKCHTPEGVFDLTGNVEEWVLDDWRGASAMLEGGAWYTFTSYADCTGRYSRQADFRLDPTRRVFSAGFRCCWTPEAPTRDQIASDARARLEEARARSSPEPYDPAPEVPTGLGTFIDTWEYPNRKGVYARTAVSWEEAHQACQQAGKRLCGAREWQSACLGLQGAAWPWGADFQPGICGLQMERPSRAGEFARCLSGTGAADMVGGVWEWTAARLDAEALTQKGEVLYEIRGGSWYVDPQKGRCVPREGYPAAPKDAHFPDVGFRCCRGELTSAGPAQAEKALLSCPAPMVAVGEFCIDAYEYPGVKGQVPTGNLDLAGAQGACGARGLHVCTEAEWEHACAGKAGRRWPYGDTYNPDACHDESRSRENTSATATAGGAFPGCATPEGVFDLSGNLWEWVVDAQGRGVIRGGGWNLSAGLGQCSATFPTAATYKAPEIGTRCCGTRAEIDALKGAR